MFNGARILVAPLDWGLGHAARCVPIINALQKNGAVPLLGADGGPLELLKQEFPELEHVRIPGMTVRYGKGGDQLWSMVRQFPAMVRSVSTEHALFRKMSHDLGLDAVISDQRFGIRSTGIPSVLITHQVFPFSPFAQGALRKLNLRNIARFDRCWIMDEPDAPGLAGDLSHGTDLPANARYIGVQSRMKLVPGAAADQGQHYRIVAVISGPEPQRSLLEEKLVDQMRVIEGEHLLVRGLPREVGCERIGNITRIPHMRTNELASVLSQAELIVSRSGYTTLMDLGALCRTALIIPTPGQPEQEYLAALHGASGRFIHQTQNELDLKAALTVRASTSGSRTTSEKMNLERALEDLADMLQ